MEDDDNNNCNELTTPTRSLLRYEYFSTISITIIYVQYICREKENGRVGWTG